MVKDSSNYVPMNMIALNQTSLEILEYGDVLIFLVVLFTPKDLRYNLSPSVSHYPPSARRLIQSVYDYTVSAIVQHQAT